MMSRKTVLAAVLSLTLMGSMVPSAMAEVFHRTITLGPGAGAFTMEDLGVGDEVVITLVNPTNAPMVFETTENIGNNKSWTVPANSSATVNFTYTKPFDDDVEFVVRQVGVAEPIATGVFIQGGPTGQEVGEVQTTTTTTTGTTIQQQPVSYPTGQPVRGYW